MFEVFNTSLKLDFFLRREYFYKIFVFLLTSVKINILTHLKNEVSIQNNILKSFNKSYTYF